MTTKVYAVAKALPRLLHSRSSFVSSSTIICEFGYQSRMFGEDGSSPNDDPNASEGIGNSTMSSANEWRKQQLEKLENRFKGEQLEARTIESEDDLQPMWKEMEGRVTRRKLRTLADTGGKTGRRNVKKTDEDVWLEQGLYSTADEGTTKTPIR